MGTTIGFLHTANVHVATFNALVAEQSAHIQTCHLVVPSLLEQARSLGVDDLRVRRMVEVAVAELCDGAERPDVIVCTCSTVSGVAEQVPARVAVLRIDRPMAEAAVLAGCRLAVVTAVDSTVTPTISLLTECAVAAGAVVEIVSVPCSGAWLLFKAGDINGYLSALARHVDGLDASFDVVVLAQASMLRALDHIEPRTGRVVLASPPMAVAAAIALLAM